MAITRRERWMVGGGGIVVVLLIGVIYGLLPFLETQRRVREEIRVRRAELLRYRRLQAEEGRYRQAVEELTLRLHQAEGLLFQGEKLPLVAAELQGLLHTFAREAGLTIVRENVLQPKPVESLTRVAVELTVKGEMKALRDFLYKIGTAPKLLTVPKLVLRSRRIRGQPPLRVDLQIAGYVKGGAG